MSSAFDGRIVRRESLGDKQLVVLDDLFSPDVVASLYQFLRLLPYKLEDIDSEATAYSKHWKAELPPPMAASNEVFRQCVELTHAVMPAGKYRLRRIHANLHLYGDMQFPHVDLTGGVTAVYYANVDWDPNWFGETVFYDEHREPVYALGPKPGRIAIFHADILHRAGVPSRECFEPRITLAFKFSAA